MSYVRLLMNQDRVLVSYVRLLLNQDRVLVSDVRLWQDELVQALRSDGR